MSRIVSIQKGEHTYAFRFEPENEGAVLNLLTDSDYCTRVGLSEADVEELWQQLATGQSYPPQLLAPKTSTSSLGNFVAVPFCSPMTPPSAPPQFSPMGMPFAAPGQPFAPVTPWQQSLYAMAWQAAQAAVGNRQTESDAESDHPTAEPESGSWPLSDRFSRW